jgi:hypothetical protein
VVGASKVARDITERKQAEAALKEAVEELEAARSQAERGEPHEGRVSRDA